MSSRFTHEWFTGKQTCNTWTGSLKNVPIKFDHELLRQYLISSRDKTFDRDSPRAYKSLKAYTYFQDGYVQRLSTSIVRDEKVNKSLDPMFVCRAQVMASMAKKHYNVFVCLDSTSGTVLGGSCECVAGKGEACSNIAAILFALDDYVSLGLHTVPDDKTVTDKLQKWNKPARRQVEAKTIQNIDIYQPKYGTVKKEKTVKTDPRHPDDRIVNTEDRDLLHAAVMQSLPTCGFAKYGTPPQHLDTDVEITTPAEVTNTAPFPLLQSQRPPSLKDIENAGMKFREKLVKTDEEIVLIEKDTEQQSTCTKWYEERRCRLTASNFHAVVFRRPTTNPSCLLKKLLGYGPSRKVKAMTFGLDSETPAIGRYETYMASKLHQPVKVRRTGFRICKEHPFIGASIDGICEDPVRGTVLIELKNPLSTWDRTIEEACLTQACLKLDENKTVVLNKKHAYHTQIQGQMGVHGVKSCDFVLCTKTDILVESVSFDEALWIKMLSKLEAFYNSVMLPEIIYPALLYGNEPLVLS